MKRNQSLSCNSSLGAIINLSALLLYTTTDRNTSGFWNFIQLNSSCYERLVVCSSLIPTVIMLKEHCLVKLFCQQQNRPKLNPLGLRKWHSTSFTCCVLLFSCSLSSHWYSSERHSRANVTQRTYLLRCQWKSQVPPKVYVCNITFVVLPRHSDW